MRIKTGLRVTLAHDVRPYTTVGLDSVPSYGPCGAIQGRTVSLVG